MPRLTRFSLPCFAALICLVALRTSGGVSPRPNILFIAVDDLRPEFGAYGQAYIKSPNLDRLASEGIVFERAYCQQAVCSPSRTSVMTGARPDTTKVWDLNTHFRAALADVVTLGQFFKQRGYFVQGMGKIYHGSYDDAPTWSVPWQNPQAAPYALPENLALNERKTLGESDGDEKPIVKKTSAINELVGGYVRAARLNSRGPAFECADVPDETYTDGKTAKLALTALREISAKREPFFLAVGFAKPHLPFVSPKKYWDLYDRTNIALAKNPYRPKDAPDFAILPGSELRSYHGIPVGPIPPDLARQLKHGYYAAISYTDAQVGKLLDELDRLHLRTNTIVVLWGDHGWKLGEHDAWCKHSNTENDVNAPLLLSAPAMKKTGVRTKALVEFVDIYPTLVELAGFTPPPHLEGTSFAPLLDEPDLPWKTAAFSQYPRPQKGGLMGYSMRTERYRFTVWVNARDHSQIVANELYDHLVDPQENTNIATLPINNGLMTTLMKQWEQGWQAARPPLAKAK